MSTINLGTLTNSPQVGSEHILSIAESTDVFQFSLASTRNINLALTDISTGDDADLRLYRDSNNNGVLDASEMNLCANDCSMNSLKLGSKNSSNNFLIPIEFGWGMPRIARLFRWAIALQPSCQLNEWSGLSVGEGFLTLLL